MSDEMRNRVLGTNDAPAELDADEVLSVAGDMQKDRWLAILIQLTNSHRFNKFLDDNFLIGDQIDEEAQTIQTLVVEKPIAVGPPLTAGQLTKIRMALSNAGVQEVDELFNKVLAILGQEDNSSGLVTPTGADIASLKGKLDA